MALKQYNGVSFLEMVVALLLSAILMTVIFRYAYYIEKALDYSSQKISSIEKNNVLFASMVRDIEMAGYAGCLNARSRKTIWDENNYLASVWLNADNNLLESQYMSPERFEVIKKLSDTEILISGEISLKVNDVVLIENCWELETAKISKIHNVNYGAQHRLEFYLPVKMQDFSNTSIAKLIRHYYFIEASKGLYVRNEKGDSDQVLEDISSFLITSQKNGYKLSVQEDEASSPILLSASANNA